MSRLATVAPDLVGDLEQESEPRLRHVAASLSVWIVDQVGLVDPRVDAALAALRDRRFGSSSEHDLLQKLADELDERAWNVQDQVEEGVLPQEQYLAAFALARAAYALCFALESDPLQAALESVYEAQAATGDLAGARREVRASLS